eukprot:GHRQ01035427.1.p1 GENE.GHRQ01035427.1~~GHRQ01035427.1.p1  ORF type:complete len:143 (+),score=32.82 GHRQ01035427.1:343-771(+)
MAKASAPRLCAALLPALLLLLLGAAEAAPTIRTDNSPVCNQIFPQCQAKCKQGLDFMFVCSAGNGPNGGPYILCQCVAPALPVGPKAQGEHHMLDTACLAQQAVAKLGQQSHEHLRWLCCYLRMFKRLLQQQLPMNHHCSAN